MDARRRTDSQSRALLPSAALRRARQDAGFSLVEVAVAVGIFAVALFGIMSMIVQTMTHKQMQRELDVAKQACLSVHEQLKGQTAGASQTILDALQAYLAATYGAAAETTIDGRTYRTTTFAVEGLSWTLWTASDGRARTAGQGTITLDQSNTDLVAVTVLIDWKSVGRSSTYSLTSMYAKGFLP